MVMVKRWWGLSLCGLLGAYWGYLDQMRELNVLEASFPSGSQGIARGGMEVLHVPGEGLGLA